MKTFHETKKNARSLGSVSNESETTTITSDICKKAATKKKSNKQVSIQSYFAAAAVGQKRKLVSGPVPLTPPTPVSSQVLGAASTPPSLAHDISNTTTPPTEQLTEVIPHERQQVISQSQDSESVASTTTNTPSAAKQDKRELRQMYLDLGQKNFGKQTVCKICGMMYVHGVSEDTDQHARICQDFVQGVPFHEKQARTVAKYDNGSVIEVSPVRSRRKAIKLF